MRTETSTLNARPTDLRWERQPDGSFKVYEPGDVLPVSPPSSLPWEPAEITVQDFRSRFTDPELAAIATSPDVAVQTLLLKLLTRTHVDLRDPQTAAGVDLLVAKAGLAAHRKDEVLKA